MTKVTWDFCLLGCFGHVNVWVAGRLDVIVKIHLYVQIIKVTHPLSMSKILEEDVRLSFTAGN